MPSKRTFTQFVYALDEILASTALAVIILLTLAGVFCRYLLNHPIPWQEEVSTVLMVWLVFMGCSVVAKKSAHIRIDTLSKLAPPRARTVWLIAVNLIMLTVLGIVCFYAARLTMQTQKLTTLLKIPYQVVYAAAPISIALIIIHTVIDTVKLTRHRNGGTC